MMKQILPSVMLILVVFDSFRIKYCWVQSTVRYCVNLMWIQQFECPEQFVVWSWSLVGCHFSGNPFKIKHNNQPKGVHCLCRSSCSWPGRKGQSFRQDGGWAWALVWGSEPFPRFQVVKLKVGNCTWPIYLFSWE